MFAFEKLTRAEMVAVYNAACDKSIIAFRTAGVGASRLARETQGMDPDAVVSKVREQVGPEIADKLAGLMEPDARKKHKALLKEEAEAERAVKAGKVRVADAGAVAAATPQVNGSTNGVAEPKPAAAKKTRAPRAGAAEDRRVIRLADERLKRGECPFRAGTERARRVNALKDGLTVGAWMTATGADAGNLRWLVANGWIKVEG